MRIGNSLASLVLAISASAAAQAPFETPDSALAHFIKSANARDLSGINVTLLDPMTTFNFANAAPVESFSVIKRIRYTEKHVRDWKRKGIAGPVAVGDLELHVREIVGGKPYMYSYNFRHTPAGWKITGWASWNDL
jgi:hypothetical protein